MVVKVAPLNGSEHLSLARLQHSNIVPLYSVVDDAHAQVRLLCMPYFGSVTLATVLQWLDSPDAPSLQHRRGADLVNFINSKADLETAASDSPIKQMWSTLSYPEVICWIAACLCDALQFAHARSLVHFDLKPSNVLLAGDGQPMLLDFHLARAPLRGSDRPPQHLGGTVGYMPPEQRQALDDLEDGRSVSRDVDARADVYALGVILYECLGGSISAMPRRALDQINPLVSAGLSDIVARALADDPDTRYPDAQSFSEDLRRHLTDQPLQGVFNRSPGERFGKWRRRKPAALRMLSLVSLLLLAVLGATAIAVSVRRDRLQQVSDAMEEAEVQLRNGQDPSSAVKVLGHAQARLSSVPFPGRMPDEVRQALHQARRAKVAFTLHELAEQIRVAYVTRDSIPPARLKSLTAASRTLWDRRGQMLASLPAGPDSTVRTDLQDVALFIASASSDVKSVELLREAERCLGRSAVLDEMLRAAGIESNDRVSMEPRSTWEHCVLGRTYLTLGRTQEAQQQLHAALAQSPGDVWSNFYAGICDYRMGSFERACNRFSVCIGASPDTPALYFNRALAGAAMGRSDDARMDGEQAIHLDPHNERFRELQSALMR